MSKKSIIIALDILYVALITILSLIRISPDIETPKIENFDKIVHFCFYFGLNFLFLTTLSMFKKRRFIRQIVAVTILSIGYSIIIELIQIHTQRSFDYIDIVANSVGAIASLIIYKFVDKSEYFKRIVS